MCHHDTGYIIPLNIFIFIIYLKIYIYIYNIFFQLLLAFSVHNDLILQLFQHLQKRDVIL